MFICVSLNPAIDKRLALDRLVPGQVHRVRSVTAHAGGKAAHVAMGLAALGSRPHWIGPSGGAAGSELVAGLWSFGIEVHTFSASTPTRTNLEILDDGGSVTEILEPGEAYSPDDLDKLVTLCNGLFQSGGKDAVVIFSGSLPKDSDPDLLGRLISLAHSFGCRTLVDSSGEALKIAVTAKPYLVKPNCAEAEELLNCKIVSRQEAKLAAAKILDMGARSVALSLGSAGLLYCAGRSEALFASALKLEVRSTVGCGDAALAGFARAFATGGSSEEMIRLASACAAANCVADSPGAIRQADVERYRWEIPVQVLR